jgi:hypothetical protein
VPQNNPANPRFQLPDRGLATDADRRGQLARADRRAKSGLSRQMANLLYLAHRLPYPPNKGDKVRSYHLLKHLAANHRVFLGTFSRRS